MAWWFAAVVLLWLWMTHEVRHGFVPQFHATIAQQLGLIEGATYVLLWSVFALACILAGQRWPAGRPLYPMGIGMGCLAAVALAAGPMVGLNPVVTPADVGNLVVLNWLLYVYLLPAFMLGVIGWTLRRDSKWLSLGFGTMTLLVVWFWATLAVRQAFQGAGMNFRVVDPEEWYAYSAVWTLLAAAWLGLGVATRSSLLRWASLILLLVTMFKVFLLDTRHLEDIWRVLSYLGLGVSLILVAWVYQRFVFHRDRKEA